MGAGEGGGGGGHQDIEEKFKKEISKEMANLKEFLIQQVSDILKMFPKQGVLSRGRWRCHKKCQIVGFQLGKFLPN